MKNKRDEKQQKKKKKNCGRSNRIQSTGRINIFRN